jgi:hypothetical protein
MSGLMTEQCPELHENDAAWRQEAGMIVTALEAGNWKDERRQVPRRAFRVKALLWLFADAPGAAPRALFTRDADHRGIGFVTRDRLPLGYGGILRLVSPDDPNKILSIPCTLVRCRMAAPGWYEGALHFNRDQMQFLTVDPAAAQEL